MLGIFLLFKNIQNIINMLLMKNLLTFFCTFILSGGLRSLNFAKCHKNAARKKWSILSGKIGGGAPGQEKSMDQFHTWTSLWIKTGLKPV